MKRTLRDTLRELAGVPVPRFMGGNEVALLQGGDELFPRMVAAISAARHEVWLATYIFHDDPAAQTVAQALIDAAARGVTVRVVIDGFGSIKSLPAVRARSAPAGRAARWRCPAAVDHTSRGSGRGGRR